MKLPLRNPARVQETWRRRTAAEYTSATRTAELLHWLCVLAVSPDLLETCHRIVGDELAHAELSRAVWLKAGGREEATLPMVREALTWPHDVGAPLELRALSVVADAFCCGETVAVPLFAALRPACVEPTARAALDRILRDEPVHAAFGWAVLDELLVASGPGGVQWLAARWPVYVERIRTAYGAPGRADAPADVDAVWGVTTQAHFGAVCERCALGTIAPRFVRVLAAAQAVAAGAGADE